MPLADLSVTDTPTERYALYGDPIRTVEPRFVHVEPLRLRSGFFAWRITPHAHLELHQAFVVTKGGGTMRAEAAVFAFEAPAVLVIPVGTVHGFEFRPDSDGWVASFAETTLSDEVRADAATVALLGRASCTQPVAPAALDTLTQALATLSDELVWSAPARALAIQAELLRLLATLARIVAGSRDDPALGGPDAVLANRFRQRVELTFHRAGSVAGYARELGVSEDRLLAACRRRFGEPPVQIINHRILVEAQRWLIYTRMPIARISHALGFRDPTYFSRFFRARTGTTPRDYRRRSAGPG